MGPGLIRQLVLKDLLRAKQCANPGVQSWGFPGEVRENRHRVRQPVFESITNPMSVHPAGL